VLVYIIDLAALTSRFCCGRAFPWFVSYEVRLRSAAMSYALEFETVDLILRSSAPTRGVDAFALSVIKAERQVRKIFTYLVFQYPAFGAGDISELRRRLAANRRLYFNGFIRGIDAIYPESVEQLIGDEYQNLRALIDEAVEVRNKVFHGQLTPQGHHRSELVSYVSGIRHWCELLSGAAMREVGYDGLERPSSFRKSARDLAQTFRTQIVSLQGYADFLQAYVQEPGGNRVWQLPAPRVRW
jgi:hypothetical protein